MTYETRLQLRGKINAIHTHVDRKAHGQAAEHSQAELEQGADEDMLFQVQVLREEVEQKNIEAREKQKLRAKALTYRQELDKQIEERDKLRQERKMQEKDNEGILALEQSKKHNAEIINRTKYLNNPTDETYQREKSKALFARMEQEAEELALEMLHMKLHEQQARSANVKAVQKRDQLRKELSNGYCNAMFWKENKRVGRALSRHGLGVLDSTGKQ